MSFYPKTSVVAPCDFSDESFKAIRTAMGLATSPADVHVVHVLDDDIYAASPGAVWGHIDRNTRIAETTKSLNEAMSEHECEGVTTAVRLGDAGLEIVEFADEVNAELIVMPSHGRSGITRLLLGSVAERVLRLAHCPVLILRPERDVA